MNKLTYGELVAWLQRHEADKTKHSGRSLLEHLIKTYDILKAAGQSEDVCNAGLFHSVYGTSQFKTKTLTFDDRDIVRGLIGDHSENVAYLFCRLNRPEAFRMYVEKYNDAALDSLSLPLYGGGEIRLSEHNLQKCLFELLTIEAANLLEQQVLWRHQWLVQHARVVGILSADDESPVSSQTQLHFGRMLEQAKQKLLLDLAGIINAERQLVTSQCWWAVNLRAMKAMQARAVLSAPNGSIAEAEAGLLSNYANSNAITLSQAAEEVLGRESEFLNVLIETEMKKDRITAKVRQAVSFSDIEAIKAELSIKV